MIRYECPNCNEQMQSPLGMAGKTEKCPSCGDVIEVPKLRKRQRFPWGGISIFFLGCHVLVIWECLFSGWTRFPLSTEYRKWEGGLFQSMVSRMACLVGLNWPAELGLIFGLLCWRFQKKRYALLLIAAAALLMLTMSIGTCVVSAR